MLVMQRGVRREVYCDRISRFVLMSLLKHELIYGRTGSPLLKLDHGFQREMMNRVLDLTSLQES